MGGGRGGWNEQRALVERGRSLSLALLSVSRFAAVRGRLARAL